MTYRNFEEAKSGLIEKLENMRSNPSRWSRFLHLDDETMELIKGQRPDRTFPMAMTMLLVLGSKKGLIFNAVYSSVMAYFLFWLSKVTWTQRVRPLDKTFTVIATILSVIFFLVAAGVLANALACLLVLRNKKAQPHAGADAASGRPRRSA